MKTFEEISPAAAGVPEAALSSFFKWLDALPFDMHSVLMLRGGKLLAQAYYAPFTESTLHRMFSVAKSFVALAALSLSGEGRINLDAPVTEYFPEYPTEFEYTKKTTLRNMLMMRSPHSKTTYKVSPDNWVESYFTVKPSHMPGTVFAYDTSAPHVLAALTEKITGKPLLDYLREKFLDKIGFSKDAYFLKDPQGVSQGGSGLMATPMDLMRTAYFVMKGGKWNGEQLMDCCVLRRATSFLTRTDTRSAAADEKQGYGMQFWRTRHNGFMFYGLGGQLALCLPDRDFIMVTTADATGFKGGTQAILDAFWSEIYEKMEEYRGGGGRCFSPHKEILPVRGSSNCFEGEYKFGENELGLQTLRVSSNNRGGSIEYTNETGTHELEFVTDGFADGKFPYYGCRAITSGAWDGENILIVKSLLIGEIVGSVTLELYFVGNTVTVSARKPEEREFNEFSGIATGNAVI